MDISRHQFVSPFVSVRLLIPYYRYKEWRLGSLFAGTRETFWCEAAYTNYLLRPSIPPYVIIAASPQSARC